jgi:hypothetical protein
MSVSNITETGRGFGPHEQNTNKTHSAHAINKGYDFFMSYDLFLKE